MDTKLRCVLLVFFVLCLEKIASFNMFDSTKDHGRISIFKGSCPGKKALGFYDNIKVHYFNTAAVINYDIRTSVDTPSQMLVRVRIEKCNSKEQPDTCQHFTTINSNQYCNMMTKEGEIWSGLIDCMQPKYRCPLKKEIVYRGKNCTIADISKFKFFPLGKNYWKFQIQLLDLKAKTLYFCYIFEGTVA